MPVRAHASSSALPYSASGISWVTSSSTLSFRFPGTRGPVEMNLVGKGAFDRYFTAHDIGWFDASNGVVRINGEIRTGPRRRTKLSASSRRLVEPVASTM